MRKLNILYKIYSCALIFSLLTLAGCSRESNSLTDKQSVEMQAPEEIIQREKSSTEEIPQIAETTTDEVQEEIIEPVIAEVDWSNYFDKINGAAVIYDPTENCYQIYNQELALTRRSPCSTFKIISSLIALENGIIESENSTRTWSGEIFWNEEWNKDIDFSDAFHASCVWYFREVIDEIGKDMIQEELNRLQYGNCDISDWDGRLNTNNNNPVLTGFWIESSLLISPKEQVEVMERIFSDNTAYSEETLNQLKQVMLLSEQNEADILIYGKTGMGKAQGIVVDSWFTGFADAADKRIFFCVYLGETDNKDVSSTKAREIAIKIVSDYLN
ncbi:MAG: class D beta-lactamase [Lachnospiraceae bacterium]|nr:class D beta-lactamase [Lachnospiraceae bacterium]